MEAESQEQVIAPAAAGIRLRTAVGLSNILGSLDF
jgi:hypothetical protein